MSIGVPSSAPTPYNRLHVRIFLGLLLVLAALHVLQDLVKNNLELDRTPVVYEAAVYEAASFSSHYAKASNLLSLKEGGAKPKRTRRIVAGLFADFNTVIILKRLREFDARLKDNGTSDFVIFHSGYANSDEIQEIHDSSKTKRKLYFYNIDKQLNTFPEGFDPNNESPNWTKRSKWGYHGMIKFWFYDLFQMPELSDVKYCMRFDDDSSFHADMPNVFDIMDEKGAFYFANRRNLELVTDLVPLLRRWPQENNVSPKNLTYWEEALHDEKSVYMWYNNFEITNFDFFTRPDVVKFSEAIVNSYGIFRYRWGDAPLRYVTLALFSQPSQVLHRRDYNFLYCHGDECDMGEWVNE